ncbi:MAG TPA: YdcF family protein [Sphingomicrobium sp.]|nr:YdcF family protein [Sphingomicrobium sp.]
MILRAASLLLILYALGFVLFSVTLAQPARADAPATHAVVVLTGGPGRLEQGFNVIRDGKARRLLVSGADPVVTKADLARLMPGRERLVRCCVDLDSSPVDTRTNAEDTRRWLEQRGYTSLRLITSDWHMRRARYEFRKALGDGFEVTPDAVKTEPSFLTLFAEYNKLVLRRLAVWLDI